MKAKGLDGRTYPWNLTKKCSPSKRSAGHLRCRELLRELFPLDQRLEEITLPGTGGLKFDFFLPSRRLAVEVQGVQHDRFVAHFHKHRVGFLQSRGRDGRKAEFCELNEIDLVELPYNESENDWRRRIVERD